MAITMVSVEFEAKLDRLQSDINKAVGMLGGAGKSIQSSMGGAAAGVDSLGKSMSVWAREQGQQARIASRLVEPLSGLADAAGVSAGAVRGLAQVFAEGALGGVGFGLALEGAQLVVSTIVGALKRAEEEAKKTAAALQVIKDRIDAIGKTPIQLKIEEVSRLRDALEEERAANVALSESGAMPGSESPEEKRLDAARAKLAEYAARYKTTTSGLRGVHAELVIELNRMEEQRRTETGIKDAEAAEKAAGERIKTATKTAEELKRIAVEGAEAAQREIMEEEIRATVERVKLEREIRLGTGLGDYQKALALRAAGNEADESAGMDLSKNPAAMVAEATKNADAALKTLATNQANAWATVGATVASAMDSLGAAIGGAAGNFAALVGRMIQQAIQLAIALSATSGPLGWLNAAAAAAALIATVTSVPDFRAMGGSVSAGQPYVVGERGPEVMVPGQSGTIIPNHKLGGGVTLNVYAMDAKSFEDSLSRNDSALLRVLRRLERNGRLG